MLVINEGALEFYAVRNKEGKWFRAKGYGGYGDTWVKELKRARIYNRIGPARTQVSFFANNYPDYGVPDLVQFRCTEMVVLDESERVTKQQQAKQLQEKKRDLWHKQYKLKKAKEDLERAQNEIKELEQ